MDGTGDRAYRRSMVTVADSSLRALLDLLDAGQRAPAPSAGLPTEVLQLAVDLVPCDVVAFNEFESRRRHHLVIQTVPEEEPDGAADSDGEALFWEHYEECLPCSYPERSGDLRSVTTVSDFYSEREFHSTGMYVDYFGPLGVEREVMVSLPAPEGVSRRLIFFRGPGRDFDDRDRLLLALLRPHLAELCRSLELSRLPAAGRLTTRQRELLRLVAQGHSNAEIAHLLFLSAGTVRKHLENIFERLGVSSRTAAVAAAFPAFSHDSTAG